MTTPHGFTDYSRMSAEADVIHTQLQNFSPGANGNVPSNTFPTFGSKGLLLNAASQNNAALLRVQWSSDSASANIYAVDEVVINPLGDFIGAVKVLAPFVRVRVDAPIAVGTSVNLTVANCRHPGMINQGFNRSILVNQLAKNVNAGTTDTIDAGATWPGWVSWHVSSALATWTAQLQVRDKDGTVTTLAIKTNANSPLNFEILVPPMPIRTTFQNTTGAAGTYNMSVTAFVDAFGGAG